MYVYVYKLQIPENGLISAAVLARQLKAASHIYKNLVKEKNMVENSGKLETIEVSAMSSSTSSTEESSMDEDENLSTNVELLPSSASSYNHLQTWLDTIEGPSDIPIVMPSETDMHSEDADDEMGETDDEEGEDETDEELDEEKGTEEDEQKSPLTAELDPMKVDTNPFHSDKMDEEPNEEQDEKNSGALSAERQMDNFMNRVKARATRIAVVCHN